MTDEKKPVRDLNLYELSAEMEAVEEAYLLTENDDDATYEAANALLDARYAELEAAFREKCAGWVHVYLRRQRMAEAAGKEVERLRHRQVVNLHAADDIKGRLKQIMERLELRKVETGEFRLSVAQNGGRPAVAWDKAVEVPLAFAGPVTVDPVLLLEQVRKLVPAAGWCGDDLRLLSFLLGTKPILSPDLGKIRRHVERTGEVPEVASVQRGTHLRIT